jgi:hypothetical protein
MLSTANTLKGYKLDSLNGDIGRVKDFYFDDRHWTIRYLVAETGGWLASRQVLISPHALLAILKSEGSIAVNLYKAQIESSPSLDSHKPVSRQFENAYYGHYGWPLYWAGPYSWGNYPYPAKPDEKWQETTPAEQGWDAHLRSTGAVSGHHVQAIDGEIGHVLDFIIDDETWAIRYFIVDTHNWLPGRKVLVAPQWIESVSWLERKVFVNLSREAVRHAQEYTEDTLVTRDYETSLHHHYNREPWWVSQLVAP